MVMVEEIEFSKVDERAISPTVAGYGETGFDIRVLNRNIISPGTTIAVRTGLAFDVPNGYELQIRSKSGLTLEQHLTVAQGVGTIDSGNKGEVCILLKNGDNFVKVVEAGSFIARLVPNEVPKIKLTEVKKIDMSKKKPKAVKEVKEEPEEEDK